MCMSSMGYTYIYIYIPLDPVEYPHILLASLSSYVGLHIRINNPLIQRENIVGYVSHDIPSASLPYFGWYFNV